ncbi:MAG: hypothetical protein HY913_12195 [Desulfomonile tiedjei]|nr:hypothetical protein [Desulfomonile tiedjei]
MRCNPSVPRILWLACLILLVATPNAALAQGWNWLPFGSSFDLGGFKAETFAKAGYQRLGLNFDIDIPERNAGVGFLELSPVDLNLRNEYFWVGSVGVNVQSASGFGAFLSVEGNLRKNFTVQTPIEPENAATLGGLLLRGASWEGSGFEWWNVDGGLTLALPSWASLVGGVRWDHLTLKMGNPYNAVNEYALDRYQADFRSKVIIPYFGFQLLGQSYKATFIGSPFASVQFKLPFVFVNNGVQPIDEARYKLFTTGGFLEGTVDYSWKLAATPAYLDLWARANWMRFSATGEELFSNFDTVTPLTQQLESGKATLSRYTYGFGLSANLAF